MRFASLVASFISARSTLHRSSSTSIVASISRMASAPMPYSNAIAAVLLARLRELVLGEELALDQVGVARINDAVGLEVQDLLEVA